MLSVTMKRIMIIDYQMSFQIPNLKISSLTHKKTKLNNKIINQLYMKMLFFIKNL